MKQLYTEYQILLSINNSDPLWFAEQYATAAWQLTADDTNQVTI